MTDDTIVIGAWAPLTGPAASWSAVGRGAELHFAMINEEGGIHGRKIDFILRDDGYQPSRTVAVVREMVERDRVFAMVAGLGTATGRAVLDYLTENEVVLVSPATGATQWAYPPKKYVFSQYTPYFDEAAVLVDYAVDELGKTKIAVIYQNDDFGGVASWGLVWRSRGTDSAWSRRCRSKCPTPTSTRTRFGSARRAPTRSSCG